MIPYFVLDWYFVLSLSRQHLNLNFFFIVSSFYVLFLSRVFYWFTEVGQYVVNSHPVRKKSYSIRSIRGVDLVIAKHHFIMRCWGISYGERIFWVLTTIVLRFWLLIKKYLIWRKMHSNKTFHERNIFFCLNYSKCLITIWSTCDRPITLSVALFFLLTSGKFAKN